MADISELRAEFHRDQERQDERIEAVAARAHQGVNACQLATLQAKEIEKLDLRVKDIEALPAAVGQLAVVVNRLERVVWWGAGAVGASVVVQVLRLIYKDGS